MCALTCPVQGPVPTAPPLQVLGSRPQGSLKHPRAGHRLLRPGRRSVRLSAPCASCSCPSALGDFFFCQELFGYLNTKPWAILQVIHFKTRLLWTLHFMSPLWLSWQSQIPQPTTQMFLTPALNASWLTLTNRSKRGLLSPAQGLWRGKACPPECPAKGGKSR